MKSSLFIISFLLAFSLKAQEFKVIEATSQRWAAGQARSGHGVNYKLTLVFNKKVKDLNFDHFWVGKEFLQLKVEKNINIKNENYFSKNDTIYLSARMRVKTNEYGDEIKEEKELPKPPLDYQGAGLLTYKIKKGNKHLIINEFKVLEPQFYP